MTGSRKRDLRILASRLAVIVNTSRIPKFFNRPLAGRETAAALAVVVALAGLGYLSYTFISAKFLEMRVTRALPMVCSAIREQRQELISAIEAYKQHFGSYPPDNVVSTKPQVVDEVKNPLLYELAGVNLNPTNHMFELDRLEPAQAAFVKGFFHRENFANCTPTGQEPKHFLSLTNLPARQLHDDPDVFAVGFSVSQLDVAPELFWEFDVSTWRYVSSAPVHNPGKFDLWIEIKTKSRSVTLGNWNEAE
jgi:hypothetical protein